jgi:hypothetical protein
MIIVKIFLVGWVVLLGAILINGFAGLLKLPSWYTFLNNLNNNYSVLDYAWLFLGYPVFLGLMTYFIAKFVL